MQVLILMGGQPTLHSPSSHFMRVVDVRSHIMEGAKNVGSQVCHLQSELLL